MYPSGSDVVLCIWQGTVSVHSTRHHLVGAMDDMDDTEHGGTDLHQHNATSSSSSSSSAASFHFNQCNDVKNMTVASSTTALGSSSSEKGGRGGGKQLLQSMISKVKGGAGGGGGGGMKRSTYESLRTLEDGDHEHGDDTQ